MNELDLIREVEKRAILYDKSVSGFNKTKLRDDAWKEVQEALHVSESECKKRWRSLRDSFIKLQRTHGGRTRWPYHQAMRFLLPHVEPPSTPKPSEFEVPVFQDNSDESEDEEKIRCLPDLSFAVIDPARVTQLSEEEDDEPPAKKPKETEEEDNGLICQCLRTDPDELFLLSCSSTLKRLNAKQNAVARLKIQQVLYEAEFGTASEDIPYIVTAAGTIDCEYESLEENQ